MGEGLYPDWIAVDWGTSNLRAYAMSFADDRAMAVVHGAGMRAIAADSTVSFEGSLLEAIAPWIDSRSHPVPVLMCGMVGSKQGWVEARYLGLPVDLSALPSALTLVDAHDKRLQAAIVPGLRQEEPANIMRGEETQLAGFSRAVAGSARVCLPGTHSKWARLDDGWVTEFSTCMTGELFDLLSTRSILSHSVDASSMQAEAFIAAVCEAYRAPQRLLSALFGIRAEDMLNGTDPTVARARLSGLLIGADLASAGLNKSERIALIGARSLTQAYQDALSALDFAAEVHDGEAMVLAGLSGIMRTMRKTLEVA
ncbi:MAG: 2-dehydro-3-deoxygalactonokinase [Pseudomonadota bacterium]